MPDHPAPPALPGDIVQVTTLGRRGALAVVETVRAGRIAGYMPFARTKDAPAEEVPIRLRDGEFVRVGTVAVARADLLRSRRQAAESLAPALPPLAREPEPDPDDATPIWEVVVRFNGRTTGSGQVHRERVRADCVEEAYDRVRLPVSDHGGAVCVVGVSIDEVRS